MLWTRLAAATAGVAGLQFVGGSSTTPATGTANVSFSLTGLTGGLASAPAAGDLVIACVAFRDGTNRNISCTTSGYTEIADLFSDTKDNEAQLGVYYKVLSTAETSVGFNIGVVAAYASFAVHVWRGQNATPIDATTTTAIGDGGTSRPDPPSITTATDEAVVVAVAAQAAITDTPLTTPTVSSGMENFFQSAVITNIGIAIESIARPTAGAYNPAAFGGFSTSSSNGWCAATIAIRPA